MKVSTQQGIVMLKIRISFSFYYFIFKVIAENQEELIFDIKGRGAIITWTNSKKPHSNKKMKMKFENQRILTIQLSFGCCKHVWCTALHQNSNTSSPVQSWSQYVGSLLNHSFALVYFAARGCYSSADRLKAGQCFQICMRCCNFVRRRKSAWKYKMRTRKRTFPKLHIGCENDRTHNWLKSISQIWYGGWFGPWKCGHCWFWSISVQQFCTSFLLFSNTWSKLWTAARGLQNSACCSEPVFTLPVFTVLPSLAMWASCNVNAAKSRILQAFASYTYWQIAKSPQNIVQLLFLFYFRPRTSRLWPFPAPNGPGHHFNWYRQ